MIGRKWRRPRVTFVESRSCLPKFFAVAWAKLRDRNTVHRFRSVGRLAAVPFRHFRAIADLVTDAWRHVVEEWREATRARRIRDLLQAVPAITGAMGGAILAGAILGQRGAIPDAYRDRAAAAFAAERWEEARVGYERLFREDGGSAESRLFIGLTLQRLGRIDEAAALICGVASGEGGGDPRASRWAASRLTSDPATFRSSTRLRELRHHLLAAEQAGGHDVAIALGFAKYYLAVGQPRLAIPELAIAAEADPALSLELAQLYTAAGQTESAREVLVHGTSHLRVALTKDPHNRQCRLALAGCLETSGREAEAVTVLREGAELDLGGPFRTALAKLYVRAYDRLAALPSPDLPRMIEALAAALANDAKNGEAALRLASFGIEDFRRDIADSPSSPPDSATDAETTLLLRALLVSGEQPAVVHMGLCLQAWRSGGKSSAAWHFGRASALDPEFVEVACTLARELAQNARPNIGRALSLVEVALEGRPDEPRLLKTRGELYLKTGRCDEAVRDFEVALAVLSDDSQLCRSLAEAYEKLGLPTVAAVHRSKAEKIDGVTGRGAAEKGLSTVNTIYDD